MLVLSFIIHFFIVIFFSLKPWPSIIMVHSLPYTVNLISFTEPEPAREKKEQPTTIKEEHQKPKIKPKKDDIVEKVKEAKKGKPSLKNLEEALEELRKKAALEEIQKRISDREKMEKKEILNPLPPSITQKQITPYLSPQTKFESRSQTPFSSKNEFLLSEYYNLIWGKIKEAWSIPESLFKETVDQEAIIVLIIERNGRIQKLWFEKRSGNPIYDKMALRAIRKAEPFPPMPKEFSENTLEIGIRFFPE